jgi:hypothetical protein
LSRALRDSSLPQTFVFAVPGRIHSQDDGPDSDEEKYGDNQPCDVTWLDWDSIPVLTPYSPDGPQPD